MKDFLKLVKHIQEKISKPLQYAIYVIIGIGVIATIPCIIKSCNHDINYKNMKANFIGEEVNLHNNIFSVEVLNAVTVDEIQIKTDKDDENLTNIVGHFVAVTVKIKQHSSSERTHTLDNNDFKLKDHTGTMIPLSDILGIIDVDCPDVRVDTGDFIDSKSSFSTMKPIKDYTWLGTEIKQGNEIIITIYFEIDSKLKVENTIMILEVDFYVGFGKNSSATDIVLFERKKL